MAYLAELPAKFYSTGFRQESPDWERVKTSQRLLISTDSLIDSLVSPAPSPSKSAGKAKAQDIPQPVASGSDPQPGSILPIYLLPNPTPGKCESVESAMKRTDTNFTILASKLDVAQATISDDIKGLQAHLTQFASDYNAPVD